MALDINEIKFLLRAQRLGVSFEETAAIGRQTLHVNRENLSRLLADYGVDASSETVDNILTGSDGYAEKLFELLGARETASFDASDYEKATYVHDFNKPIPDKFKNRFTCVIDGGTLEHVFNFPTALKNSMEMLKIGGHYLGLTPTNNYSGHGFYQFSPELYFQAFVPENGFEVVKVYLLEEAARRRWYEVTDPNKAKERVVVINDDPALLLVIAKKIADADIFANPPQQSDYLAMWEAANGERPAASGSQFKRVMSLITRIQKAAVRPLGLVSRRPDHFRRIDDNEL